MNHAADTRGLPVEAFSRGLSVHKVEVEISPLIVDRLHAVGIPESCTAPGKIALSSNDLLAADTIIALKESEHRPMMVNDFPEWADRITYWNIDDAGDLDPEIAFSKIESHVQELLKLFDGTGT